MAARSEPLKTVGGRRRGGFTLLEILVALGIISIASWILVSLFTSSLYFSNSSRTHRVAAGLAQEQLDALVQHPERYNWAALQGAQPGVPVPVGRKDTTEAGPYKVDPPTARALTPAAGRREENFYGGFTWQPYAVLPAAESPAHLEVVAVVRWSLDGKPYSLSLTSAVPRARVEGQS